MREIIIHRILSVALVLVSLALGWILAFNSDVRGVVIRIATAKCVSNEGLQKITPLLFGREKYEFHCSNGMRTGEVVINIKDEKEKANEVEQAGQFLHPDVSVPPELPAGVGKGGDGKSKGNNIRGDSRKKK